MHNVTGTKSILAAKRNKLFRFVCVTIVAMGCVPRAFAQEEEQKGIESGDYNIKQSVEFGYRFNDRVGDLGTYDTFVNLRQGPRLMDFTLDMNSLDHRATLFDHLFLTNFGYGGDPNNLSRLRISKNKWYDFTLLFRRDENAWDYSLLANPLNPAIPAFANAPAGFNPVIGFSPHLFNTVRRLGDYNLLLLPQSRVRFRLGYSRNVAEGPSFSSYHQGTEALLLQNFRSTVNSYRIGVDFKLLPRTNISYDQFFNYYKGDTSTLDNNQLFTVANPAGAPIPVDIGVSLNAGANQPCAGTFTAAGTINPTCAAYIAYSTAGRARTSNPTEQLSFQSNYFKNLDLSARISYTGGSTKVADYNAAFFGREPRTNLRNGQLFGPVFGQHVSGTADFGATYHVTDKLSLQDSFHWWNFHNPVTFDGSTCSFFSPNLTTAANVFATIATLPTVCTPPVGSPTGTTPSTHVGSSGPDVSLLLSSLLLKQDEKTNLFQVDYRFTQKVGARIGYRYRDRTIVATDFESGTFVFFPTLQNTRSAPPPAFTGLTCPAANNLADMTCVLSANNLPVVPDNTPIHEHSGLFGLWLRPLPNWRISFDSEVMSADNSFTRISPRQTQEYRLRTTYRPVPYASLNGAITIWEARDNVTAINNLQHSRAYGFSISLDPVQQFSIELGVDYNDVYSQIIICFTSTPAPRGLGVCPVSTVLNEILSVYRNNSSFGYFNMRYSPIHRVTARVGTNITYTNGSALLLNPNAVPGPLDSHYFQPYAGLDLHIISGWTAKAYWGYYGYGEGATGAFQDIFFPRNFHNNMETVSIRYAF